MSKVFDVNQLSQLNWTAIGFISQSVLLVLALTDPELARWLVFRVGLLLVLCGGGAFAWLNYGRRSRLLVAGLLLKYQNQILGGASKVFTIRPDNRALLYFGALGKLIGKPKLWELDEIMPRLPVPPLEQTVSRFLRSVQPLLSDAEFQTTTRLAQQFQTTSGPHFQAVLESMQRNPNCVNWLEEYWEKFAYLRWREPLPIASNWYGVDRPHPTTRDRLTRAAKATHALLSFKSLLDNQELEPMLLWNAVPLCMEQYRRMFNTARIPAEPFDEIVHRPEHKHLVVVYQGQLFNFAAYYADGRPVSRSHLHECFTYVIETVQAMAPEERLPSLGPLTAQDRTTWCQWRKKLQQEGNREQLELVESAIVLIVLDDDSPVGIQALAEAAAQGNADNRWFDKSGTFIFYNNGQFSGNFEHTWGDAPVMVNLITYVFGVEDSNWHDPTDLPATRPVVNQIKWNITDEIAQQIVVAKQEYQHKVVEHGALLSVLEFDQFGKNLMKNAKVSPDGFCQMALQLAYYMKYNRLCLTYESSHTRIFRHGRTETVRSASLEALSFVKAMVDPSTSDIVRHDLLKKAIDAHIAYMRQAMSGNGVDRHLLGLYLVAMTQAEKEGNPGIIPEFFKDKAYGLSYQLSTSQTPGYQTGGGGFMPTAFDGYGVSYVVNDDTLVFHISSWRDCPTTNADEFKEALVEALRAMRDIVLSDKEMRRNLSANNLLAMSQLDGPEVADRDK